MRYDHVQRGSFYLVLLLFALLAFVGAYLGRASTVPVAVLVALGGVILLLSFCFAHLRVSDGGDHLRVRFGPLPLFGTKIPYAIVRSARVARSRLVDGWGIHWLPGRGLTYNIHGKDCVELETERGRLRIGTDDPAGLAAHLSSVVDVE